MSDKLSILAVTSDSSLLDELQDSLAAVEGDHPLTATAEDYRQGIEAARGRSPDVVLFEMETDLAAVKRFAQEVRNASPQTTLAGVFTPHRLDDDIPESEIIIQSIRAGVGDFLRRPISTVELGALLKRAKRQTATRIDRNGQIVSFISNKGGVGKSTVAVNSACGLAKRLGEGRVLLIDASLQLGVCASLLDLTPATGITDAARERSRLDETLLRELATPHSCGLHLLAAPADAIEAAEIDDETMTRILTLARRSYDYVLVDTFPLFDRVVIAALDLSDRVYVISESVVPTLQGTVKLVELLDELDFPRDRRRIVLNRHTGVSGSLKPADVATRLRANVDFVFPYDKRVIAAANTGRPFGLESGTFFSAARRMHKLVDDLQQLPSRNGALENGRATAPQQQPEFGEQQ